MGQFDVSGIPNTDRFVADLFEMQDAETDGVPRPQDIFSVALGGLVRDRLGSRGRVVLCEESGREEEEEGREGKGDFQSFHGWITS